MVSLGSAQTRVRGLGAISTLMPFQSTATVDQAIVRNESEKEDCSLVECVTLVLTTLEDDLL